MTPIQPIRWYRLRVGGRRTTAYLCKYHAPERGGTYQDEEVSGVIEFLVGRDTTDSDRINYGADECDSCLGSCTVGPATTEKRGTP